jgi:GNAT superfamily N-acetyltransferase
VTPADRPWITGFLRQAWAGPAVVTRGKIHRADELPGFLAARDGAPVGLATYRIEANQCEIITFNSMEENAGVGTALLAAVADAARRAGCRRLWLVTTNDNTAALRFYQRRGLHLVAVHRDALDASRKLKPGIPLTGNDGIPLRDEIELEMVL